MSPIKSWARHARILLAQLGEEMVTLYFKGIENFNYYGLVPDNLRYYMDYTGTGNTLNVVQARSLQLSWIVCSTGLLVENTDVSFDEPPPDYGNLTPHQTNLKSVMLLGSKSRRRK
jgi:hypothetical protein